MNHPIRILHIIDTLQKGGAERLLIDYVKELQIRFPESEQTICTLRQQEDEIPVPEGVVRINGDLKKWNFFQTINKLNKYVNSNNINIVHSHLVDSILFSRMLRSPAIEKKIFTYHNFYFSKTFVYYSAWRSMAEKITYKKKYISIYVSEEVQKCIEAIRRKNGRGLVFNNFPNPSFYYCYQWNPLQEIKAVVVANLRKTKNIEHAISELALLKDLPISIHVFGDGALREPLQKKINELGVKVFLHGRKNIDSGFLGQFDFFLMTSESEGFPLSLLEAMATGLPCVLPDHLAIFKEVASECSIFYSIYKKGDLAMVLQQTLKNKSQLKELSLQAREKVKPYRVESYAEQIYQIYQEKNLLFVIDSLNLGGAEKLLVNTVNELTENKYFNIHLITTQDSKGRLRSRLHPDVKYSHIHCKGLYFLTGVRTLRQYLNDNNIILVHAHLENSIIVSRFAIPGNIKLISTYHNMEYSPGTTYYSPWRVWIEKLTYKQSYVSIYVSKAVEEVVEKVRRSKRNKHFVLPNFLDNSITRGYNLKQDGALRIITVANLKKPKNIDLIIRVMQDLKDYPIIWDVYGEGDERGRLEKKISEASCKVFLRGTVDISNEVLLPYDLFILTSLEEGMPMALLEVLSFGLPALLPDHLTVMREVAGDAAKYFSIKDQDDLKLMILNLLINKEELKEMSNHAHLQLNSFSSSSYIKNLTRIYMKQLSKDDVRNFGNSSDKKQPDVQ